MTAAVASVGTVGGGCHDDKNACYMLKRLCGNTEALRGRFSLEARGVSGCLTFVKKLSRISLMLQLNAEL